MTPGGRTPLPSAGGALPALLSLRGRLRGRAVLRSPKGRGGGRGYTVWLGPALGVGGWARPCGRWPRLLGCPALTLSRRHVVGDRDHGVAGDVGARHQAEHAHGPVPRRRGQQLRAPPGWAAGGRLGGQPLAGIRFPGTPPGRRVRPERSRLRARCSAVPRDEASGAASRRWELIKKANNLICCWPVARQELSAPAVWAPVLGEGLVGLPQERPCGVSEGLGAAVTGSLHVELWELKCESSPLVVEGVSWFDSREHPGERSMVRWWEWFPSACLFELFDLKLCFMLFQHALSTVDRCLVLWLKLVIWRLWI